MYRAGFTRSARLLGCKRAGLGIRLQSRKIVHRSYSSAAHGANSTGGGNPLNWTLTAAAALSAIYFVYPFEKKPKEKKQEEPAQSDNEQAKEAEPESEQSQESESDAEEPQSSEQESDEPEQEQEQEQEHISEEQPTKEETVTSTDAHQTDKDIESAQEIQKAEEEQLAPTDEEAKQEGAYNPDTGEINWDCPCLGGMAHGPCGEEFKAAFSCFVYSEAEPKGIDCVEKFQHMQDCFREHPEHYAEQIKDEEDAVASHNEESKASDENGGKQQLDEEPAEQIDQQTSEQAKEQTEEKAQKQSQEQPEEKSQEQPEGQHEGES